MSKLVVHGVEEPFVQEVHVEFCRIEAVHIVQHNLHTTLGCTEHYATIGVVGYGTDEVQHFRRIGADEVSTHELLVRLNPEILGELGQSNGLVVIGRSQILRYVRLFVLEAVLKVNIVRLDIVLLKPSVEFGLWCLRTFVENAR